MKKIFTLFIIAVFASACTTEEANINEYESQDISKMSETDFINFMETIAINRNAIPGPLNADDSIYPYPIESITSYGEEKFLIPDPSNGECVEKGLKLGGTGTIGDFSIERFADTNGNQKIDVKFKATSGWFISSISLHIDEDCQSTPKRSNGEPDITDFNIRNCFSGRRTGVTYRFAENCIPDCACVSAYVVMYTVRPNGSIDQCVGVWVDGEQLGQSSSAKSNSFCKSTCGEVQNS